MFGRRTSQWTNLRVYYLAYRRYWRLHRRMKTSFSADTQRLIAANGYMAHLKGMMVRALVSDDLDAVADPALQADAELARIHRV